MKSMLFRASSSMFDLTIYSIAFLLCAAALSALAVHRLLRLRRSFTLKWPEATPQREQAQICRRFLARSGIDSEIPQVPGHVFQLIIRMKTNVLLVAFRNVNFPVTESFLRDFNENVGALPWKIPILVLNRQKISNEFVHWSKHANLPIILANQLPTLRDLLKAPPKNLRAALFEMVAPGEHTD